MECCNFNKNPLGVILKLIAVIALVYGLWEHNWTWIIIAIIIAIIGCLMYCRKSQSKAIAKPKKRRK